MRTTINIDDDLLAEAQRLTGVKERTQIIRDALVALIERESALRLARLGGWRAWAAPSRIWRCPGAAGRDSGGHVGVGGSPARRRPGAGPPVGA